jgi:hypothetical protein
MLSTFLRLGSPVGWPPSKERRFTCTPESDGRTFGRKKTCGEACVQVGGCPQEWCHRFASDTEMEGGSRKQRSLKEEYRRGYRPKTDRSYELLLLLLLLLLLPPHPPVCRSFVFISSNNNIVLTGRSFCWDTECVLWSKGKIVSALN